MRALHSLYPFKQRQFSGQFCGTCTQTKSIYIHRQLSQFFWGWSFSSFIHTPLSHSPAMTFQASEAKISTDKITNNMQWFPPDFIDGSKKAKRIPIPEREGGWCQSGKIHQGSRILPPQRKASHTRAWMKSKIIFKKRSGKRKQSECLGIGAGSHRSHGNFNWGRSIWTDWQARLEAQITFWWPHHGRGGEEKQRASQRESVDERDRVTFVSLLLHRAGVKAEGWGVQTGWGIAEMRLFDPQERRSVLALLVLAGAAGLVAHQQDRDEEDAEDREGVEEDEVEEGVVWTNHWL